MKYFGRLILLFLVANSIVSCSHTYYMSNTQQVNMFEEKNEARIFGAYGYEDGYTQQGEGGISYSITDKFAASASYMFVSGSGKKIGGDHVKRNDTGTGHYGEISAGYYKPLTKHFIFDTYVGIGMANQRHNYNGDNWETSSASINFQKYFVQPSFGYHNRFMEIALSSRLSTVYFNGITFNGNLKERTEVLALDNSLIAEPAVTLSVGLENIKAQAQVIYTAKLAGSDFNPVDFKFSFGLIISPIQLFTKLRNQ